MFGAKITAHSRLRGLLTEGLADQDSVMTRWVLGRHWTPGCIHIESKPLRSAYRIEMRFGPILIGPMTLVRLKESDHESYDGAKSRASTESEIHAHPPGYTTTLPLHHLSCLSL